MEHMPLISLYPGNPCILFRTVSPRGREQRACCKDWQLWPLSKRLTKSRKGIASSSTLSQEDLGYYSPRWGDVLVQLWLEPPQHLRRQNLRKKMVQIMLSCTRKRTLSHESLNWPTEKELMLFSMESGRQRTFFCYLILLTVKRISARRFDDDFKMIKRKGTLVSVGNASGPVEPFSLLRLTDKNIRLLRPMFVHDHSLCALLFTYYL